MHAPTTSDSLRRVRFRLRSLMPSVKAAHVAEALAAAAGFNSAIAMKTRVAEVPAHSRLELHAVPFAARLAALGHDVTVAACQAILETACTEEAGTSEGMKSGFLALVGQAVSVRASDIVVSFHGEEARVSLRILGVMIHHATCRHDAGISLLDGASAFLGEGVASATAASKLPGDLDSMRITFTPTVGGRLLSVRLRYAIGLGKLGFSPFHLAQVERMRDKPYGMIVVGGPTGSGRFTTVQNLLISAMTPRGDPASVAAGDKIVTCEDAKELLRGHPVPAVRHRETRPPDLEVKGEISMSDLVKASLRHRPERIVIGEVRGKEAFDLLQAMNTGYESSADHGALIARMRKKPFVINVLMGSAGTGKWKALQHSLEKLMEDRRAGINTTSMQDPPEYVIQGASSFPVIKAPAEAEIGKGFRDISDSLRSDPTAIVFGEVFDRESASTALACAMTGHQAWVTIHANDAMSIVDRFGDIGIEGYKLADNTLVSGLTSQRLVRTPCPKCSMTLNQGIREGRVEDETLESLKVLGMSTRKVRVLRKEGCHACGGRGVSGRIAICETVVPDRRFLELLVAKDRVAARAHWFGSLEGRTMVEYAVALVLAGEIDPTDAADKVGELVIEPGRHDAVRAFLHDLRPKAA